MHTEKAKTGRRAAQTTGATYLFATPGAGDSWIPSPMSSCTQRCAEAVIAVGSAVRGEADTCGGRGDRFPTGAR